jgi:hypothetical protein
VSTGSLAGERFPWTGGRFPQRIERKGNGERWQGKPTFTFPEARPQHISSGQDATPTIERHGIVDIPVNNAGGFIQAQELAGLGGDVCDEGMEVNLKSVYLLSRADSQIVAHKRGGRIIHREDN